MSFFTKTKSLLIAVLLAFSLPVSTIAHEAHGKPTFGGIFAEAGVVQLELVLKSNELFLYVLDHGKPIDLKGATAKVTLLSGAEKTELTLVSIANRFEGKPASGSLPSKSGVKVVAILSLPGKPPITARFEVK